MKQNSHSARLECPGCGSSSFTDSSDGSLICDYCHATYVLPGRCPACGAVCDPGTRYCPSCGADLVRECPACGALNPPDARKCSVCGYEMEILDQLFDRVTKTRGEWLQEVRDEASVIKAQEEAASQARVAEMWAIEERRREALAQARAERDRQQRIIVNVTVAIVVVVIVLVLITLAITTSRTQSPYFYPF